MKIYEDCEILYLTDEDLNKHGKTKSIEELDYTDFIIGTYNPFIRVYVVIYKGLKGEYKVLKSRF